VPLPLSGEGKVYQIPNTYRVFLKKHIKLDCINLYSYWEIRTVTITLKVCPTRGKGHPELIFSKIIARKATNHGPDKLKKMFGLVLHMDVYGCTEPT